MCYAPLQAAKVISFVPSTSVKPRLRAEKCQVEFIVAASKGRGMCGVATSVYVSVTVREREQQFKSILYLSITVFLLPLHTF